MDLQRIATSKDESSKSEDHDVKPKRKPDTPRGEGEDLNRTDEVIDVHGLGSSVVVDRGDFEFDQLPDVLVDSESGANKTKAKGYIRRLLSWDVNVAYDEEDNRPASEFPELSALSKVKLNNYLRRLFSWEKKKLVDVDLKVVVPDGGVNKPISKILELPDVSVVSASGELKLNRRVISWVKKKCSDTHLKGIVHDKEFTKPADDFLALGDLSMDTENGSPETKFNSIRRLLSWDRHKSADVDLNVDEEISGSASEFPELPDASLKPVSSESEKKNLTDVDLEIVFYDEEVNKSVGEISALPDLLVDSESGPSGTKSKNYFRRLQPSEINELGDVDLKVVYDGETNKSEAQDYGALSTNISDEAQPYRFKGPAGSLHGTDPPPVPDNDPYGKMAVAIRAEAHLCKWVKWVPSRQPYRRPPSAPWVPPESQEPAVAEQFEDTDARNTFVRNVYAILTIFLTSMSAIIYFALNNTELVRSLLVPFGLGVGLLLMALGFLPTVSCNNDYTMRRFFPVNMVLLIVYMSGVTLLLTCLSVSFAWVDMLFMFLFALTIITFTVTLCATQSEFDIANFHLLLFTFLAGTIIYLVVMNILFSFFHLPLYKIIYSFVWTSLCTVFLMIDTALIVNGQRMEISLNEYAFGAVVLLMEIPSMFVIILLMLLQIRDE